MAKKKTAPELVKAGGVLYVRIDIIGRPLAVADGATVTFFGDDEDDGYIPIDAAIQWCERPGGECFGGKHKRMIAALNEAKSKFASDKAVDLKGEPTIVKETL